MFVDYKRQLLSSTVILLSEFVDLVIALFDYNNTFKNLVFFSISYALTKEANFILGRNIFEVKMKIF